MQDALQRLTAEMRQANKRLAAINRHLRKQTEMLAELVARLQRLESTLYTLDDDADDWWKHGEK